MPNVVVSIAPIHSLAAMAMAGIGRPQLLLSKGASPHAYALKPSDARALARAHVVVWVGPALEGSLAKPLETLAGGAEKLTLLTRPGLILHASRRGGVWKLGGGAEDGHGHSHAEPGDGHGARRGVDPHIWLDPRNGILIVEEIARTLARIDGANGARYAANAVRARRQLTGLDRELTAKLRPVSRAPYLVFHDAYRYFEERYGLSPVGSVVMSADRRPGIKRIQE
ncbi:MAG: zinc ABC transporter substrate-binding protein, partial [Alphaproteobacteria bacterium]|nr:zinc ABC transporter substrate-binding protein [Alphaproteobacteria bacterium]